MDRHRAYKLLADTLHDDRDRPFKELVSLIGVTRSERVIDQFGNEFLLEVTVEWASRKDRRIRITASADSPSVFRMERLEERIVVADVAK